MSNIGLRKHGSLLTVYILLAYRRIHYTTVSIQYLWQPAFEMSGREPPELWKKYLREYHGSLRSGFLPSNILPAFRKHLTEVEYRVCIDAQGEVARVDALVDTLLTKDYRTFEAFCIVLETNGYSHWADKLRGKGTQFSVLG